ncbi:MAG: HEAT repeat domain-containing protein [Candidatus Melainabacteria bacterium]
MSDDAVNPYQSALPGFESLQVALQIASEKSQPPKTRLDAILFIIEQFDTKFLPLLESILNDAEEHPDVRSAAALALGKLGERIGTDKALPLLASHLHSDDETVRNYTVQALGMLGEEAGIPLIIEALGDDNNQVFASAAEALGLFGREALPHLVDLLERGADDARCVAAWKLGEMGDPDAVPALVRSVQEVANNVDIKALSIWALGEIGHGAEEVITTLSTARSDADPKIHERASMAMKKIARHLN